MPEISSFVHDPNEVADYVRDWTALLDGDTIATSTWIPDDGIDIGADDFDDSTATVWISGGTLNATYKVVNRITTAGGRTFDKTLRFQVRPK